MTTINIELKLHLSAGLNWQLVGNSYLSVLYHCTLYYLPMGLSISRKSIFMSNFYKTSTFSVMTSWWCYQILRISELCCTLAGNVMLCIFWYWLSTVKNRLVNQNSSMTCGFELIRSSINSDGDLLASESIISVLILYLSIWIVTEDNRDSTFEDEQSILLTRIVY